MTIGIIGYGFVGSAIYSCLVGKSIPCAVYDRYKSEHSDHNAIMNTNICFVCVPTPSTNGSCYDLTALHDVMSLLEIAKYGGIVVIKSTVLPGTTQKFAGIYSGLKIVHNPEFLTARTAAQDFENQRHVIIGSTEEHAESALKLRGFYEEYFPLAKISLSTSTESESVKIFCNTFYASKVQLFTEFKLLCDSTGANFESVRNMMLDNGWINPMHTLVPGTDGKISYGGLCFPKDTTALLAFMKNTGSPCDVLDAVVSERNKMRDD